MRTPRQLRDGFTLIELLVVVLMLGILVGALAPRVSGRLAAARDSRRLSDMRALRDAIERYRLDQGSYPPASVSAKGQGWDVSTDTAFIPELLRKGYLREALLDPLNDEAHFYAYNVFLEGSHGCTGMGNFYVLAVKQFETLGSAQLQPTRFSCAKPEWAVEFEHVSGGGATLPETRASGSAGPR